ncbi:ubiquitin carboxyl-terminal hydrolase [Venturia nashicola]|uniref:ubiquitinyl hydrolase 1 n=1 Tax=Venturia nashicola TaxID=86259 RepID=A0A4Z1PDD4_9PEZI|nr:ubiquitin carboxyl-terminal hydrolase [Venturia nashicola]
MPPLPYEKLIELLEAKKGLPRDKTTQPGKTAKSFSPSPLAPRRSNNGVRKTLPSLKKDTPRKKLTAHLELEKTVLEEMDTVAPSDGMSVQDLSVLSKSNDFRKISPPLVQDRLLLNSEPESPTDSKTSIENPSTLFQAPPAPSRSHDNQKSSSLQKTNYKNIDALKKPKQRLRTKEISLSENPTQPFQQHSVLQKMSNVARRSSWPQICKGQGPRGLYNPHNYCYRRSVLQALLHLPSFLHVLELHKPGSSPLCDPQNCTCVACGLKNLSTTYWTSENRALITNAVKAFDTLVNNRAPKSGTKFMFSDSKWPGKGWRIRDQMDAQEWCLFLLDQMVDPQMQKNSKSKSHMDRALRRPESQLDPTSFKSQMKDVFELSYSQTMTCGACRVLRRFHGLQKILGPLPLASSNSGRKDISSCLKQFFSTDFWEVKCENKRCPKFNKPEIKNRVTQSIVSAPEVLMIQLKCFMSAGKRTGKKNPNIDFGHDLSLSNYASKELLENEGEINYKLSSMVIHQGSSLESGHYVGVFTSPTGLVYHISDEHVSRCSSNALTMPSQKGTPYILCYTRVRAEDKETRSKKYVDVLKHRADSAQRQNSIAPVSKPQRSMDTSENRPVVNLIQHDLFEPSKITPAKPPYPRNGLLESIPIATYEIKSIVSSPQSQLLGGYATPSIRPNPFHVPGCRPPSYNKDLKSNITNSRDVLSVRDGRPKPVQQLGNILQNHEVLSKNQIRKLKKKQRRLLGRE